MIAALLAALLSSPRSARAGEPHYPFGTQPGELEGVGTPLEPVETCRTCHGDYDPGDDYEPYESWKTSAMANATRDPVFQAALTIAVQDDPGIGEYCLRCHTPHGWLAGRADPADGTGLDPAVDHDGITCDTCHRMIQATYVRNAIYYIDYDRQKHGKYADALDVGHANLVDPFTSQSDLCGTCHHVSSPVRPFLRADGTEAEDSFPFETTYLEWEASDFADEGTRCIDCHMPPAPRARISAVEEGRLRDDFRRHDLLGSNAWLGRAISWIEPELGREAAFEAHAERTRAFLRQAATVELTSLPDVVEAGETIEIGVHVTNLTGHKLPTGYADGRRMWLEVSIGDEVVSGAYDEGEAELASDPPPKIWEAVHGNADGPDPSLPHQDTIVFDDRIPPAGFEAQERTALVGAELEGNWDDVRLSVRVPDLAGDATVRVRLRHQVLSREYVEFLRDENVTDDRGEVLWDAWSATGRAPPEDLAETQGVTTVEGGSPSVIRSARGGGCRSAGEGGFAGVWLALLGLLSARARGTARAEWARPPAAPAAAASSTRRRAGPRTSGRHWFAGFRRCRSRQGPAR